MVITSMTGIILGPRIVLFDPHTTDMFFIGTYSLAGIVENTILLGCEF